MRSRLPQRSVVLIVWFALILMLPCTLAAQSSSSDQTFSSNSELVLVPVEVLDRGGQPLRGLKQQDFVVNSDGNPQHISIFEEIKNLPTPAAPAAAPPIIVTANAPQQPATHFTNVPEAGVPQQLVILAIDTVNTPFRMQNWARQQVARYLKSNPPRQPVELIAITPGGVRQLHPFTTDAAALIASLDKLKTHLNAQDVKDPLISRMDPLGNIDSYASMMNELQERQTEGVAAGANRTYATLHNFEEIAWSYAEISGRKTVLWLTTGFPIQQMVPDGPAMLGHGLSSIGRPYSSMHVSNELLPAFQRAFTALNKSNVTVYPVDVQGLPSDNMWDITMPSSLYDHPEQTHLFPIITVDQPSEDRDGMKELAHRTGGKSCTAGNNLTGCLNHVLAESSDYYLLGFYVSQQKRKPGWHKLKVHLNVDHGEINARNSYFLKPLGSPPEKEQEEDLRGAIDSSVNYTGVLLSVQPGTRASAKDAPFVFKVSVPSTSILMLPGEDKLSYDVISIPLSANGTPIKKKGRIVKLDIKPELAQKALTHGWSLVSTVEADGSPTAIKVVIRDNGTGRIGSLTFPVAAVATGS